MDTMLQRCWRDVLALTAIWSALHFLAPAVLHIALAQTGAPGLAKRMSERIASLSPERQRTLRRRDSHWRQHSSLGMIWP